MFENNYRILYKTERYEGEFYAHSLDEAKFKNVTFKAGDKNEVYMGLLISSLKIPISAQSPLVWTITFMFLVVFLRTLFIKFEMDPGPYAESLCDVKWAEQYGRTIIDLFASLFLVGGPIVIGLICFMYTKTIKDYHKFIFIRGYTLYFLFFFGMKLFSLSQVYLQEDHYQSLKVAFTSVYSPKTLKNSDFRGPASEDAKQSVKIVFEGLSAITKE